MRGFKTIAPPQKYMDLREIHAAFGKQNVVAYGCKPNGDTPEGGFVVAVQVGESDKDIREYLRQFRAKFPDRAPVCLIRVPVAPIPTADKSPEAAEKERLVNLIPEDVMALMIKTAFEKK